MNISHTQIRSYRLHAHSLDKKIPSSRLLDAAGACGLQNSPPGAWETALYNRLEGCTLDLLQDALYQSKTLLQAWALRGTPVVFPTAESGIFLTPLAALNGEQPWIYTRGISAALDFLQMPFDDLLARMEEAAQYLDSHTVQSKEALDRTLADIIQGNLPAQKQPLWTAPSMYGSPDRQTVGQAAVSFLLRPCSYLSLVVFGRREGNSPAFTSFQNWTGHAPFKIPDAEKALVRKFLHCYGPATKASFMDWLGCSPKQAQRLWGSVADEILPVTVDSRTCYLLSDDMETLLHTDENPERLLLLGAHDPYLDIRDRSVILEQKTLHKAVWKTVANPGVVLKGGRVAGIWKTKTAAGRLNLSIQLFETLSGSERKRLESLSEAYAAFRLLDLRGCDISI